MPSVPDRTGSDHAVDLPVRFAAPGIRLLPIVHDRVESAAQRIREQYDASDVESRGGSALVILSGQDLAAQPGIAGKMFRALSSKGINIDAISTSLASITCLIENDRAEDAVETLKDALGATE